MKKTDLTIEILPNLFLKEDGTFDLKEALLYSGKIAGICYAEEGFKSVENEPEEKTNKRIDNTLNNRHFSVYDHVNISFNIHNIPKLLAMVLNNEHQYTTSERSLRYKKIKADNSVTLVESILYDKWFEIIYKLLEEKYSKILSPMKIKTLSQENARYLVSVFVHTEMVYTTSLRQINNIAAFFDRYIENADYNDNYEGKLASYMKDFNLELERLNVLDERLMINDKNRSILLFAEDKISNIQEHFDYDYSTNYLASYAELAEAQRSRKIDYQIERIKNGYDDYAIPAMITDDYDLRNSYLDDINSISDVTPQGTFVLINEQGNYKKFIEKSKERLCFHAQNEIMDTTHNTMLAYTYDLKAKNSPFYEKIKDYNNGARCTFPDYNCTSDCKFKEAKTLTRKI